MSKDLRDFRLGTVASNDYETPLTGYEPNREMNFVDTEELDLAATSDIYWQHTFDDTSRNDPDVDDNQLAMYFAGVVDSTGKPVAQLSGKGQFSWDTRNLKSAQNQFPVVSRPEMICQFGGSVQTRVAEEREIAQAQIRTKLDEQRRILTAECSEKVLHHELLAAHAEQDRKILHEELRQQQEFREVCQQDLMRHLELQKFQNSESQKTIMNLSGRLQELQNEVNLMNDSKDFMDAESTCSGNPHVTSTPGLFPKHPPFEGLLKPVFISQRQDEEPPNIWDTSGISGNVFANPQASSSAPYSQELNSSKWNPWRETTEEPIHKSIAEKSGRPKPDSDLRCQSGPSAKNSVLFSGGDFSKNYGADQQRLQISDLHFDKFPTPATFLCWKIRFKTEVCTCSQFPTEAMQWIKEVELADSVDELRSSSSIRSIPMPDFEVLDARIASALNKIIHNSHFKRRISLEEQKAQKQDSFLRGRQIDYLIYDYFRVTGVHDSVGNYADLFTIVLRNGDIQEFDSKWDGILLSMTKIPPDDILEGLYKLRIRESDKLKTFLELYDLETHQKKLGPDYHRLKAMVKRSIAQEIRNKNFEARSGNFEKNAVVKNPGIKQRAQRILGDCWQWEANGQCVKGDNCSFRHDTNKRGKSSPSNPSQNSFTQQSERKPIEDPKSQR